MYTRLDHKKHKSWIKIGFGVATILIVSATFLSLNQFSPFDSNAHALGSNTTDFVTTWQTTSVNEPIVIPVNFAYTYDYNVDWGDGIISTNLTTSSSHTYSTAGSHQIRISGLFPAIYLNNSSSANQQKLISIDQWGNNQWRTMSYAFAGATNLTYAATDRPDLSQVTDLSNMFFEANKFNGAIGNWDTSHITNMSAMFYDANQFNQDLSGWNTANVADMSFLFAGYNNPMVFNQNLSNWNTSNVTTMTSMFQYDSNFNQDISGWDVSKVTDMSYMFVFSPSFNKNLNSWNTGSVTTMSYMFYDATSFNQDLNMWDTSQVMDMSRMFGGSSAMIFNGDISTWNVGKVTDMSNMFANDTTSIFNRNISSWNVSNVVNMRGMFYHDSKFNQDLSLWNTTSVTNTAWMFAMAAAFNGNVSTWDTSHVTDMSSMFVGASVFNQPIDNWNVSNVTDMNHMFNGAFAFNKSLNNWNVSKVTNMASMFQGATSFDQDLNNWNTGNVLDMDHMFNTAYVFNQSLDGWDVSKVTDMQSMFQGAPLFNQDLNDWKTSSLTNTRSLFDGATNFNGNISNWDMSHVTEMWATFKYATSFNQDISNWNTSSATDMKWVFLGASSFNHDLSNWDVSHATDLTYFFYQTGLTQSNYEATLIGWSKQSVKPNVALYADTQTYCSTLAQNARNILTSTPNNWVITGDTLNCSVPSNQAPVASNKNIITILGKPSTNAFPATDPDENNLYFDITSQPTHGTVVVNQDGTYTYTPNPSYIGSDSFSYKARDQQVDSNAATIAISVANPVVAKTNGKVLANNAVISAKPTFSGTAPAGTTVTVTVHSDPLTCVVTADADGNWSCTLPTNLEPGEHTVRIVVTYAGGTVQELGPYTVTVDANGTSPVLSPNTGYGVDHENWQLKLIVTTAAALVLISLGALGLRRTTK